MAPSQGARVGLLEMTAWLRQAAGSLSSLVYHCPSLTLSRSLSPRTDPERSPRGSQQKWDANRRPSGSRLGRSGRAWALRIPPHSSDIRGAYKATYGMLDKH